MPTYNDDSALAVLFRLPQADGGLYVVATVDTNDLAEVFVAQKLPQPAGHGPARYERQPMTERVRERLLASGFMVEQLQDYAPVAGRPVGHSGEVDLKWLSGSIGEVGHRLSTHMPNLAEWADRARDCGIAAKVLGELATLPVQAAEHPRWSQRHAEELHEAIHAALNVHAESLSQKKRDAISTAVKRLMIDGQRLA